ncbi:MAG: hypothetical protein ABS79_01200 [Planctomycetes bacterium SCN 63-9]|nr:MAG: hypothetical protein ABS79_01200 [Planctomycetes bacterium SCN 63-9]
MSPSEHRAAALLEEERARLLNYRAEVRRRGGEGNHINPDIDRLRVAIDAIKGDLHRPHCAAQLTSGR